MRVARDHGVANRSERGRVPSLARGEALLSSVLINGDLDGRTQLRFVKRLQEIAERLGVARTDDRFLVCICRQEEDRELGNDTDLCRSVDPIQVSLKADVHSDEVGSMFCGEDNGVLTARGCGSDRMANALQLLLNVARDDPVVLEYEDASCSIERCLMAHRIDQNACAAIASHLDTPA